MQAARLKNEAMIDQLQRKVAEKPVGGEGGAVVRKMLPEDFGEHTPEYYMTVILTELKEKRKENENLALKVEYDQKMRSQEAEHQAEISALKTQLKRVFNLDLQNLKLAYEHQLKQVKISMKQQEEEIEILRGELVKRESEICLLREKNKHAENERRQHSEHAEFLARVFLHMKYDKK